jgi:hypothetical protein
MRAPQMIEIMYLPGKMYNQIFKGLGPDVYGAITNGKIMFKGSMKTAMKAKFSLGTPNSITFNAATESAVAVGILKVNMININECKTGSFNTFTMLVNVSVMLRSSSDLHSNEWIESLVSLLLHCLMAEFLSNDISNVFWKLLSYKLLTPSRTSLKHSTPLET